MTVGCHVFSGQPAAPRDAENVQSLHAVVFFAGRTKVICVPLPSPLGSLPGCAGRLTPQPSSQIPLPAPPRQRQSQKTRPHRPHAQTDHPRQPPLEKSQLYPCLLRQLLTPLPARIAGTGIVADI